MFTLSSNDYGKKESLSLFLCAITHLLHIVTIAILPHVKRCRGKHQRRLMIFGSIKMQARELKKQQPFEPPEWLCHLL